MVTAIKYIPTVGVLADTHRRGQVEGFWQSREAVQHLAGGEPHWGGGGQGADGCQRWPYRTG